MATTIKLRKPSKREVWAVERERYEILRELTKMMFRDGITVQEIDMLTTVSQYIRSREEN
jgi:hypothetical protein